MKLFVRTVPYSSVVVGGGLALQDEDGRARFQVMFIGTTAGITKEETAALSEQISAMKRGLTVPDRT